MSDMTPEEDADLIERQTQVRRVGDQAIYLDALDSGPAEYRVRTRNAAGEWTEYGPWIEMSRCDHQWMPLYTRETGGDGTTHIEVKDVICQFCLDTVKDLNV